MGQRDINEARARLQRLANGGFVPQVYGVSGKIDFRTDLATVLAQPAGVAGAAINGLEPAQGHDDGCGTHDDYPCDCTQEDKSGDAKLGDLLNAFFAVPPTIPEPVRGVVEAINCEVMPDHIWLVDLGSGDIEWSVTDFEGDPAEDNPVGQVAYVRAALAAAPPAPLTAKP